ncbi:CUBN-like protein [Mya arenaria]|uniref:CUBN-like protein n=1 Tax=Mya arenaria TaxID=6604 RepID=A0ABY7EBD0_MYAAR|nr:protein SpAN-like [Mya arenaria]XP_052808632.1 protein SpAN-like [Mya arenaria]WAR07340.1 CUBN-like protein [Mya arenaria]
MLGDPDYLAAILILTLIQGLGCVTGESVSACFRDNEKALQISCGSGYMVRITGTFYGYSYTNTCSFRPGDCTQAKHTTYPCTGYDSCTISLPTAGVGKRLTECDNYSTYFQVEYTCEPVTQTTDICRQTTLTSQRGYISTPHYPGNYRDNTGCETNIKVDPSQQINLTVIDMDLEINGTYGCHDWMYAYNQHRSVTLCGRRSNEKLVTLQSNEITITFQSDVRTNKKGFWIYYEAWPPLVVTRPPTMRPMTHVPSHSPDETTSTPGPVQGISSSTASQNHTPAAKKEKLPFVAIVSGVIGTLTFILIVLLVILVYRWLQDKRDAAYKHKAPDIEYLDARNPAYRSSTGTEFGGIEIYYNR